MLTYKTIVGTFCLICISMACFAAPACLAESEWSLDPVAISKAGDANSDKDTEAQAAPDIPEIMGLHPKDSVYYESMKKEADNLVNAAPVPMSPDAVETYRKFKESEALSQSIAKSFSQIQDDLLSQGKEQGYSRETLTSFVDANKEVGEYAQKHLLVFISSSMPEGSLRNYLAILGKSAHVSFLIRGLVDNDITTIAATREWAQGLLCHGEEGKEECYKAPIDINPILFERLKVDRVPAIAYVPSPESTIPDCDDEISEQDYLLYYGDFSPIHILETFIKSRPEDTRLRELYSEITGKQFFRDNDAALIQ